MGGRQNPVWVNVCAILELQLNTCYSYNNLNLHRQTLKSTRLIGWLQALQLSDEVSLLGPQRRELVLEGGHAPRARLGHGGDGHLGRDLARFDLWTDVASQLRVYFGVGNALCLCSPLP